LTARRLTWREKERASREGGGREMKGRESEKEREFVKAALSDSLSIIIRGHFKFQYTLILE
jgi:hypothetical protein